MYEALGTFTVPLLFPHLPSGQFLPALKDSKYSKESATMKPVSLVSSAHRFQQSQEGECESGSPSGPPELVRSGAEGTAPRRGKVEGARPGTQTPFCSPHPVPDAACLGSQTERVSSW